MEQPTFYWRPSIAVSSVAFYTGDLFPYWEGHLLVGALSYEEVRLLNVEGGRVIHEEVILKGAGRVRDAIGGPDGRPLRRPQRPRHGLAPDAEGGASGGRGDVQRGGRVRDGEWECGKCGRFGECGGKEEGKRRGAERSEARTSVLLGRPSRPPGDCRLRIDDWGA